MGRSFALIIVLVAFGGVVLASPSSSNDENKTVIRDLAKLGISIDWSKVVDTISKLNKRPSVLTSFDNQDGALYKLRHRRSTDGLDWNIIVDNLLEQAKQYIIEEGKDEIPIPDINESFEKRYGFIKARGSFEASEGRVNSLSSIRRTGEVFFTSIPGVSVSLTTHLGFGTLRVRYNRYRAEIWRFGPRGRIEASVGSNSVKLRLRMDIMGETTCKLVLEEVSVETLDGFDVDVTGLGPLDWLTSKIATWVAENRRGDIKANAEKALRRALERSLEKLPCDPAFINM